MYTSASLEKKQATVLNETFFSESVIIAKTDAHFRHYALILFLSFAVCFVLFFSSDLHVNGYNVQSLHVGNTLQHDGCSVTFNLYIIVYLHRHSILII